MALPPLELFSLKRRPPCCRAVFSRFGVDFGAGTLLWIHMMQLYRQRQHARSHHYRHKQNTSQKIEHAVSLSATSSAHASESPIALLSATTRSLFIAGSFHPKPRSQLACRSATDCSGLASGVDGIDGAEGVPLRREVFTNALKLEGRNEGRAC